VHVSLTNRKRANAGGAAEPGNSSCENIARSVAQSKEMVFAPGERDVYSYERTKDLAP
jgi:hypothetical protein